MSTEGKVFDYVERPTCKTCGRKYLITRDNVDECLYCIWEKE